jgi:branched-chain amino acid aminotransferase
MKRLMLETLEIKINKTPQTRLQDVDFSHLVFGKIYSDHMFMADFKDGEWQDLQILPYQKLAFAPSLITLHYGQAIFEGMKAYLTDDGQISVFRPHQNFERINKSAQ